MKLSEFSVKNSLTVNALSVFLIIAGLFSLVDLEREAFPNFSFDIVTVRADYPGASPDVIEKLITIPLEKELKEVDDIDEMGSVSVEGLSLIILQIDPDAPDTARVVNDIQRAVEEAQDLPQDLEDPPRVRELQVRNTPIVEVSLAGDLSERELRDLAVNLETEILDLPEVASVERKGMRDPEIWVEVDPKKMARFEIALPQVMQALADRNVNVPGGVLKGLRTERILRTTGEFETASDVSDVIIRANEEGYWVRIKDVADVKDRFEELTILQRTDGSRAINLLVIKKDRADAIRTMDKLEELLERFKEKAPPELHTALVNDISYYIKRRLNVLVNNGSIGLVFVLIPIIIFLSTRVAIGAAIGMPIAFLTAIAAMRFLGMSINLISMFGMIMCLGMLVDEDLVVAENIARHLERGMSHSEAAMRGAAEVAKAIISVVLTTIIAFLPLLFMTGIFGKFVGDIPKVVMITLAASLLEALIILPSHLSDLNKPRREDTKPSAFQKKRSHHLFDQVRAYYLRSLGFCLRYPKTSSLVALSITTAAILWAIFGMRFILFPSRGIEAFFVRAEASIGTSLEVTEKMMEPLEALVRKLPDNELDHYVTQIGISQNDPDDPFTNRGSHLAQIQVQLTPEPQRDRTADDIMESLRPHAKGIEGFEKISFDPIKPGPPVGKPVAIRIRGEAFQTLNEIADLFKPELQKLAGVHDVRDDYELGKGELLIAVNEEAALRAGLDYRRIGLTVRQAFEGMTATTIRKADEEIDVVVRLPEELRYKQQALESLLILNNAGNFVSLERVAELKQGPGVGVIKHFDAKRAVTVTANIDEELTTSVEVNRLIEKKFRAIEKQYPGYTITYAGEAQETAESLRSLFRAFIAAAILIFIILLVTFGSITQTFIVMLAIPFGLVGVVLGFTILGEPFTFLAMLGIVGLSGIVVDTGILLFIFINQSRGRDEALKDSIIEGCRVRLRPIFLTTVTTFLGVLPAAYGIGGSDPFIRPMALAINWGLVVSMFFTLYAMPCLYFLAEHWMITFKHRLRLKVEHEE